METTRKLSRREKLSLIGKYLRPCWGHFAAALLCACLAMVFNALTPQIIRLTVDSILGPETPKLPGFLMSWLNWAALEAQPLRALWWAAAAVLLTALLRGVCSYGQRLQLARGSESYVKGIRDDLYRHIQYLPFAWHKNNPTGDIIQRCTSDVDVIRQFVCNQLVEVVRTVFLIVLYLCIMFTMNLRLSLISALFIPIVGLSSGVFYKKISVYWASGTLLTCLQVMVIVVAGACECVAGRMTLGSFVAFVTYNEALAWPVRSLGRVLSDMSKAGVSMDRVGYILNAREERDLPDAVDAVNGDIVFDHVSFTYDGQPVLEDVSFTIHQGETFAILGGTGSGKSTLVHLLDRLYDLPEGGGSITIGGVDIRRMKRESLRRQIGLVLQEPFLFSQTVGENICAVRPDAGDEAMRRAAAVACVDEAISAFPQGYDTVVGERGVTLSGGQKQRVAIARMLMQQAPIMVFDDSLSAVDAETDAKIRTALRDTLHSATVLLISHRVTTLMQADRILVLDGGRVSALGAHRELIDRPGIYRDIYDIQMRSDDRALVEEGGNA